MQQPRKFNLVPPSHPVRWLTASALGRKAGSCGHTLASPLALLLLDSHSHLAPERGSEKAVSCRETCSQEKQGLRQSLLALGPAAGKHRMPWLRHGIAPCMVLPGILQAFICHQSPWQCPAGLWELRWESCVWRPTLCTSCYSEAEQALPATGPLHLFFPLYLPPGAQGSQEWANE